MSAADVTKKYRLARARTTTVVNRQYEAELAVVAAARAFAGVGTPDSGGVAPEAAHALLELARWMAYCTSSGAGPLLVEPRPDRDPVIGVPLVDVPRSARGVALDDGAEDVYRIALVTHVRVVALEPVVDQWPDDLPLVDNSGFPFMIDDSVPDVSGFKFRTAYVALLGRLEAELAEILTDDGGWWSWSDGDDPDWHPEVLLKVIREMRRAAVDLEEPASALCRADMKAGSMVECIGEPALVRECCDAESVRARTGEARVGHNEIRCVVADPPWPGPVGDWRAKPLVLSMRRNKRKAPTNVYKLMSLAEIHASAPVTAPQAHLWLWALPQHVDWAWETARRWGFEPLHLIAWAKPGYGTGGFRANTEYVVLARKGGPRGNPFGPMLGTHYAWPRTTRHSAKPREFLDLVERVSPGPYLEMFAREHRPGWESWGDELPAISPTAAAPQGARGGVTAHSSSLEDEGANQGVPDANPEPSNVRASK